MRTGVFDIPQELRIQILSHLDAISLTRCALTCKSLYDTFRTTAQLQYIIQLHFGGLTDAGVSTAYPEFIQHLQRRRRAWLSPHAIQNAAGPFALNVPHVCHAYELVAGAFAHANEKYFEIIWLPTASNPEPRTLRRAAESTGIQIRDFAMDPTQDVIALLERGPSPLTAEPRIEVRVHIHAISTGMIHPLAHHSPLQLTIAPAGNSGGVPIHDASMQFARNTLVLYFVTHLRMQPYIQIWDWTTGEVISDCSQIFAPTISRQFQFSLLDPTYCFITSTAADRGRIRLYKLLRSPTGTPRPAIPLAILCLPPTAAGTDFVTIDAHSAPIEAHPLDGVPFVQNDGDRLHVFTVQYLVRAEEELRTRVFVNLFVHQRVLLACAQRYAGGAPLEVPWEEWGPRNTRLMYPARVQQRHWMRYVHGQRVVCPQIPRDVSFGDDVGAGPSTVEVLDFSRGAVLAVQQKRPPPSPALDATPDLGGAFPTSNRSTSIDMTTNTSTTSCTSSVIAKDTGIFQDDVETHLPCVVTEWRVRRAYGAYMIHGEGIVGVNMDYDNLLLHAYPV